MNVEIPSEFSPFMQQMMSSGSYRDENEIVVEGLRLLKSREQLRSDVDAGVTQLENGEGRDGIEVFRRLADRAQQLVTRDEK